MLARRHSEGRTWMTSGLVLMLFLGVQLFFDATMDSRKIRKPTACFRSTTPEY